MNNKEAIRRQKNYYKLLEKAITQSFPLDFEKEFESIIDKPEIDEFYRMTLLLWKKIVAPLDIAITFVHNNRVVAQEKENIIHDEFGNPFLQSSEIYDTLRTLIPSAVSDFISVLPISSGEMNDLVGFVESGEKEKFISLIEKTHCETSNLSRLCFCCMDDVMAGLTMSDEDKSFYIDNLVGRLYGDEIIGEECYDAITKLQPHIEQNFENGEYESTEQFYSDYHNFLEKQLAADLYYYWNYYDIFTLKERKLIEAVFDHPLAADLVSRIREEYLKELEPEPFTLPDDYFSTDNLSGKMEEYFNVHNEVRRKGVKTFVDFVNWLAEEGFIANDNETKALFAYRLTGRCRPEGDELPVIEWRGRKNRSYELIFIVKNLSDRGDYKKMKQFFTGPDWVKDSDSSYELSADSEFRRRMADIYPGICEFRK